MMANEKCVLDIMESKGYIKIMSGSYSRKEIPIFDIEVENTIKDSSIRAEIYQKLYKKIKDSNKYIFDTGRYPQFCRKKDVINFVESFIESNEEVMTDGWKPSFICEFINNHFDCIEIRNNNRDLVNNTIKEQRLQKEKRHDMEALELLNNIL